MQYCTTRKTRSLLDSLVDYVTAVIIDIYFRPLPFFLLFVGDSGID